MRLQELISGFPGGPAAWRRQCGGDGAGHGFPGAEAGGGFLRPAGEKTDGHRFVMDAFEKGAAAAVVEEAVEVEEAAVQVPSARRALAVFAERFYGCPLRLATDGGG